MELSVWLWNMFLCSQRNTGVANAPDFLLTRQPLHLLPRNDLSLEPTLGTRPGTISTEGPVGLRSATQTSEQSGSFAVLRSARAVATSLSSQLTFTEYSAVVKATDLNPGILALPLAG